MLNTCSSDALAMAWSRVCCNCPLGHGMQEFVVPANGIVAATQVVFLSLNECYIY